jgi:hypothetical protein
MYILYIHDSSIQIDRSSTQMDVHSSHLMIDLLESDQPLYYVGVWLQLPLGCLRC